MKRIEDILEDLRRAYERGSGADMRDETYNLCEWLEDHRLWEHLQSYLRNLE